MARQKGKPTRTCPMCGTKYTAKERAAEVPYTCIECGGEGLDCCVPGRDAVCAACEERDHNEVERQ